MSNDGLVGETIAEVRPMTDDEMEAEGWSHSRQTPPVIVLESGNTLYPSKDPEGNGPGALFGTTADGTPVLHQFS